MNNEVSKSEEILKKTDWQRKTYPLKLKLTDVQQVRIEAMAYEFKKLVNGAIKIILENVYPKFILNCSEKLKERKCPLCKAKKKLTHVLEDYEVQSYGKDYRRVVWKKGEKTNVCNCFEGNTSPNHRIMRMFLLPSKDRTPKPENDITKFGESAIKTVYDSALQKAMECIKSQVQVKEKLRLRMNFLRERIMNNQIKINSKEGEDYEKYGEKILKRFISKDAKMIERLSKRFAEKIEYKYDVIRLYESTYFLLREEGEYYIKIKDFVKDNWLTLEFYGEKHQKKLASSFIISKNAETEIIKRKGNFYLQYIYRQEVEIPIPDETFTAVGIDVNVINLACYVLAKKNLKPFFVKFYSGRSMRHKRKRFKELRKIWNSKLKWKENGGKGKSRKWFNNKVETQNEKDYVKYKIHKLTTSIIQEVKDTVKKPVIVLENLKDIRDRIGKELKIQKCSIEKLAKKQQTVIRGEKLLSSELNNWNFDDFQKFIEYKANWLGIPVVYVKAKNTSLECNKCGHCEEDNYADWHTVKFKCKECGYECNVDYNAGLNIARNFFKNL